MTAEAQLPAPAGIQRCERFSATTSFVIKEDDCQVFWALRIETMRCFCRAQRLVLPPATFDAVRATALVVRDALTALRMPAYVKTTGSKGVHVTYRSPWSDTESGMDVRQTTRARTGRSAPGPGHGRIPDCEAPAGRVLVDYNQNAWGRTLASVYSPRSTPTRPSRRRSRGTNSQRGATIGDFHIENIPRGSRRRRPVGADGRPDVSIRRSPRCSRRRRGASRSQSR